MAGSPESKAISPKGAATWRVDEPVVSAKQCVEDNTQVNINSAERVTINQPHGSVRLTCPETARNKKLVESIQTSLKRKYVENDAFMVPFLYEDVDLNYSLQDYYLDLKIEEKTLSGVFKTGSVIPLDKIFYSEDKHGSRFKANILITGDAGYGKTTLTRKLCWDWAELQPGSYISCYDIVITLSLIKIGEKAVRETIINSLEITEREFGILISMNLKWLIILDGLDEAAEPDRVFSFLRGHKDLFWKNSQSSTVIVTTRSYAVKSAVRCLFNRRLAIMGLSTGNQRRYIDAIFPKDSKGKARMIEDLKHDKFLLKAAECPLLLHMLCHVYEMEHDNDNLAITSKTVLYTKIFKLLQIRYFNKHKKDQNHDDIIGNSLFIRLGQLANHSLRSYDIIDDKQLRDMFPEEKDYDEVLGLGIISGVPTKFKMKSIVKYDFFHSTFAEFLEAVYIVSLSKDLDSMDDFGKVLPTYNDFGTAIFVSGLMGSKIMSNKSILLWVSGNRRTLTELLEIKNEGGLDASSWSIICSLIRRIEYSDTVSERLLVDSEFNLDNFQVIEIRTNEPGETFWSYVRKIVSFSNPRIEYAIHYSVSVVHYLCDESRIEIRFIDMEEVMNELLQIGNLLQRNENPFCALVYIHPADITYLNEDEIRENIKNNQNNPKRGNPIGLLAKSFCSIPQCQQENSGGFWRFGKLKLCYCKQFGIAKTSNNYHYECSAIPVLVVTKTQYNLIKELSSFYYDNLCVVDFKNTPMYSRKDDFRTPKQIGNADARAIFDYLHSWKIEVYHTHEWNSVHELINSLEVTLQHRRRPCNII